MSRYLAIAVLFVALAVSVPHVLPGLIATLTDAATPAGEVAVVEAAPIEAPPAPASARRGSRVIIPADENGHYVVDAEIGGRAVHALIDTGATAVVLTEQTARRLGFHLSAADYALSVRTANGVIKAAPVVLPEIRVGDIVVSKVEAAVVHDDALSFDLLGMTFLGRLKGFESGGGQMTLTQ